MERTVKNEQSISKMVNDILSSKPFIQDLFRIDAVNYSGLARYLIPEIQRRYGQDDINIDAVIMAVKRFGDTLDGSDTSEEVRRIVSECSMFVKNDLIGLTLRKSRHISDVVLEFQGSMNDLRGEVIYVLMSTSEVEIVTERKLAKELFKRFDGSEILHADPALALIGIKKPDRASEIPGIISHLSKFLALEGISLIHTICVFNEINFIVREKDASKAYTVLDAEIKKERQRYN